MQDDLSDVPPRRFRLRFSLLFLLLVVTGSCVFLGWYVQPERATATALFEVSSSPAMRLTGDSSAPLDVNAFELLKKTQLAKLKSNYVLTAAIRNPAIASLPIFNGKADPVEWLSENLEVGFPQDSELLEISLTGVKEKASDVVQVVDAVAKAYKDEVISDERQRRLSTRDLLARNLQNLNEEIKRSLDEYNDIARESGKTESGSAKISQQLGIKSLDRIEDELIRLESEAASDPAKAKTLEQRISQLHERQAELVKQLTSSAENSTDLQMRRAKLEQLQKTASELAMKLEMLDIEAGTPDQIRQVQQAVIKTGD
jgi:hypothetical protein